MARRPAVHKFWQNIAPPLRAAHSPVADNSDRIRHWLLVLEAKNIPFRYLGKGRLPSVYVPPVAALAALHEILAFEREEPVPPLPQPPERRGTGWYAALLALLVLVHRARWSGLAPPFFPADSAGWLYAGGLDAYKVSTGHEWWRAITSLTLHADGAHLTSNLVTGCVFGIPLCRYTGVGFGFFLTVFSGACGNVATAWLRPPSFVSQGFSTAVFASVGLLAAFSAAFAARHAYAHMPSDRMAAALRQGVLKGVVPIGAGFGLLAMLGGSHAPNVDYLAHMMGLFMGIVVGLITAFVAPGLLRLRGRSNAVLQTASVAVAIGLIAGAWCLALG